MAPKIDDLKFFYSGAANVDDAQTDPSLSLGGNLSSSEVPNRNLNNIFSDINLANSRAGMIDFRALFIKNTGAENFTKVTLFIKNYSVYVDKVYLGKDQVAGNTIQTISSSIEYPECVDFKIPGTSEYVDIGALNAGAARGIWFKRETPQLCPGGERVSFEIGIKGRY